MPKRTTVRTVVRVQYMAKAGHVAIRYPARLTEKITL